MAQIPPWLDFSPQTFASAAEAGQRLQQGRDQISLERQRLAQSASQAAAELGMKHQQMEAQAKQQAIENQVAHEQMQQNFLLDQTKLSVNAAYQQQQEAFKKKDLEQRAQATAYAHADRLAAIAARRPGAGDSVKITDPASAGAEAIPGEPAIPASNGWLNGWVFGIGSHPNIPAVPGIPAVPAHPQRTFTYHVPGGTTAADAFRMADGGAAPTNAPAKLKFVRDKDGNLVASNEP